MRRYFSQTNRSPHQSGTREKRILSLIQCDTNFNVTETSRKLQLKLLSECCAISHTNARTQMSTDREILLREMFGMFMSVHR